MRKCYFLLLVIGLCSCDDSRIYEEFKEVDGFWLTEETLSFDFEVEDSQSSYTVTAEIKNDLMYPYRNFYFNYRLQTASDSLLKETLEQMQLFEPKTGEPYGSGIGDQYNNEIVLEAEVQFPEAGAYRIDLTQFMRTDSLEGIQRVGIRIEKAQ